MGVSAPLAWANITGKPSLVNTVNGASGAITAVNTVNGASGAVVAVPPDVGSGAVGSFCFSGSPFSAVADGATTPGSGLSGRSITSSGTWGVPVAGAALAGTWRNISGVSAAASGASINLFQRIA